MTAAVEFTTTDALMTMAIVLLILLSVLIAIAETAITRISKTRAMALQADGNKRADKVLYVINNFERSLNAIYLVALGCQTIQASLTGIVASNVFGPWGVAVGTIVNVLVVFIIAEAAPKTWALQHTDRAALLTAPLIILLSRIFRHIANVLIWITNLILPGKGLEQGPFVSEEEIIALMGEAAEAAVIEEEERDLIESIIDFGDTIAREIMVPRTDMVTFEAEYRVADCVEISILNGLSRFPVFRDNVDEIIGIVYAKDLMRAERDHHGDDPVEAFVRDAFFVPETKRVAELLREMQTRKTHIAIIVDEYGGTAGLITLEDMLEELVGEITDEFDTDVDWAEQTEDGAVLVHDASTNVDDINDRFELNLPEGDWDSVGGLVFSGLGRVPEIGDTVEVAEGYRLTVEGMDGRRVERVRIEAFEPATESEDVE